MNGILRGCGQAPWPSLASQNAVRCTALAAHESHKARIASERRDLRYAWHWTPAALTGF
jgi:hypothetical protein